MGKQILTVSYTKTKLEMLIMAKYYSSGCIDPGLSVVMETVLGLVH